MRAPEVTESTPLSSTHTKRHDKIPAIATLEHLGKTRQYWRDIILGVNDGLISTFLLVAGVAGAGMSSDNILLTALAGALAGAVSMCAGEYVATKSQNEVMHGEIDLETHHVRYFSDRELTELPNHLELIGIHKEETELQDRLLRYYSENPDALLKIMTTLEFGVLEEEERSPFVAGLFSCFLFFCGSIPSVVPFIFSGDEPSEGLMIAAVCTTASLLFVGAVKTWATRGNLLTSALENLVIAGFGGVLAYFVGSLFDRIINS